MVTRKRFAAGLALALVAGLPLALVVFFVWLAATRLTENHDRFEVYRKEIQRVREQYLVESLETRLPLPPNAKGEHSLSEAAAEQLRKFEQSISAEKYPVREERLQRLHEGTVEEFVNREGVGAARMFGSMIESVFAIGHQKDDGTWVGRNKTSIPQPRSSFPPSSSGVDPNFEATPLDSSRFLTLHFRSALHFTHPKGFGVMKDRRHVVGFQAHQFNELIEEEPWKVLRLELVGLLLEDRPRVYVTETLPRMQEMRGVPTRVPDAFEAAGLEKLHDGDDLFIRDTADGIRMLGAIRSAHQCIQCHGGERGALLGAFSYALQREP